MHASRSRLIGCAVSALIIHAACGDLDASPHEHSQRTFSGSLRPDFKRATSDTERIRALNADVTRLTHRLSILEHKLEPVRRTRDTILFEDVNVRILSTQTPLSSNSGDGLGNLVLGPGESDLASASHNLVLGKGHSIRGQSNAILGEGHDITSNHSLAVGRSHRVSGHHGSITGGEFNSLRDEGGHIGTGQHNDVSGRYAAILSGDRNRAIGPASAIISGTENRTVAPETVIVNGLRNTSVGMHSIILTGEENLLTGSYSLICTGQLQSLSTPESTLLCQ